MTVLSLLAIAALSAGKTSTVILVWFEGVDL